MVDRKGDGAGEGAEGTDYLTRGRGLYLKNYEFLECHEWWTERETVQAKGVDGTDYLTRRRGVYAEKLRISLIAPMVDRDEGDATEKRRRTFFSSLGREL
jgi:hypothetical protein